MFLYQPLIPALQKQKTFLDWTLPLSTRNQAEICLYKQTTSQDKLIQQANHLRENLNQPKRHARQLNKKDRPPVLTWFCGAPAALVYSPAPFGTGLLFFLRGVNTFTPVQKGWTVEWPTNHRVRENKLLLLPWKHLPPLPTQSLAICSTSAGTGDRVKVVYKLISCLLL